MGPLDPLHAAVQQLTQISIVLVVSYPTFFKNQFALFIVQHVPMNTVWVFQTLLHPFCLCFVFESVRDVIMVQVLSVKTRIKGCLFKSESRCSIAVLSCAHRRAAATQKWTTGDHPKKKNALKIAAGDYLIHQAQAPDEALGWFRNFCCANGASALQCP